MLKKAERIARAKRDLQKTLEKTGYAGLKAAGHKSRRPDFPDYSCSTGAAPLGNGFGTPGRGLPPPRSGAYHRDAQQFPVGNNHKQGPQLVTRADDLAFMSGRKT